jgi:hypothetical protein
MHDAFRMIEWLILAVVFYVVAVVLTLKAPHLGTLQTLFWKLGHVTVGAFLGYWVDRMALGRVNPESEGLRKVARAIIIFAAVFGVAGGL